VRLASWNVNGLRARLDFVRLWLEKRRPDVVGLQELKLPDDRFPHEAFSELGYRAVSHGQKSWNGVAVLCRGALETEQRGLPGQEELGARLLTVRLEDGLSFTTVYCPNGKSVDHADFPRKLAWLDALARHWSERHPPGEPAVLCGDFNVVPAPLDSWNEEELAGRIFHTDEERAALRRLHDAGLVDGFRALHPGTQAFSWWDYRGGAFHRRQGLRIDLVLATSPVMERAAGAEIDRDFRKKQDGLTASDHAPVWLDLAD